MGDMDQEDTKSLDSGDEVVLTEERSENHSSISDMVHLEREEVEMQMLEEADIEVDEGTQEEEEEEEEELQTSVLSVLGGERELEELSDELRAQGLPEAEQGLQAPETMELLMSVEDPFVQEVPAKVMHFVPRMTLPVLKLEPPSAASTPVPSALTLAEITENLNSMQELHPPPVLAPVAAQPPVESQTDDHSESSVLLPAVEEPPMAVSDVVPEKTEPEAKPEPSLKHNPSGLPRLLCGSAALVAIVGVAAYGAVAYCKK